MGTNIGGDSLGYRPRQYPPSHGNWLPVPYMPGVYPMGGPQSDTFMRPTYGVPGQIPYSPDPAITFYSRNPPPQPPQPIGLNLGFLLPAIIEQARLQQQGVGSNTVLPPSPAFTPAPQARKPQIPQQTQRQVIPVNQGSQGGQGSQGSFIGGNLIQRIIESKEADRGGK